MKTDPSFESPFSQSVVALAANQPWTLMQQDPFQPERVEKIYNKNTESGFNQADIALGIGQGWAMMSQNPFTADNSKNKIVESNFSQGVVGVGMGQDWALLDQGSNPFDATKTPENEEAGFKVGFLGIGSHRTYCGRYCKALGYLRSMDKYGFVKCVKDCQINFKDIKAKRYKIKPAPEMDPNINVPTDEADLPELTTAETGAVTVTAAAPASNTGMYLIIGFIVLAIIITIVVMMMKKRSATPTA